MVLSQDTQCVAATPVPCVDTVRRSGRKATPAGNQNPPAFAQAVPSSVPKTTSARKQQKQQQSAGKKERSTKRNPPPQQPSAEEIARQGGLYFDMEGRPVFVEMKPATFYGA